ncbi:MAG TPA: DegV family protein [Streptosporangiaceae bacterium]|jgi:DegV family protein with EDD domain
MPTPPDPPPTGSGGSGSGRVAVVTDSTAYLPSGLVAERGITVVPLAVVVDGVPGVDGEAFAARDVAEALRRWAPVTTSRPSPERFAAVYAAKAAAGAPAVVSVHLSGAMSGTVESARLAAADAAIPVEVVDTRLIGMGLGLAVLAAAEAAASGATAAGAAARAADRASRTRSLFCVDDLEHLRRGGRIGAAQTLVGSALAIKPVLGITDGRVEPLEKVRTYTRAVARMEDLAAEHAGPGPADVAVQHLDNAERAEELAARLRARLPAVRDLYVSEVGTVIAAHVGPGMLGVAVVPVP